MERHSNSKKPSSAAPRRRTAAAATAPPRRRTAAAATAPPVGAPRRATLREARMVRRIALLVRKLRRTAEERARVFERLAAVAGADAILVDVPGEGWRVVAVGRPTGRYVFFPEIDFVTNRAAKKNEAPAKRESKR